MSKELEIKRSIAEAIRSQHEQWAVEFAGAEAGKYTGAAIVDLGSQLGCFVYGFANCSSHKDAADQLMEAHAGYGRPCPQSMLIYGNCRVEGCSCAGELGLVEFVMPSMPPAVG